MKVSVANISYGGYPTDRPSKTNLPNDSFGKVMSVAAKQTNKQEDGEVLGIAMLKEPGTNRFWGMKAMYADSSTPDNPVIHVETNYGGKKVSYDINVNEVNPNSASRLEMFALCSYKDDMGIGDKSTFGTYQTLRSFAEMAQHNGYLGSDMSEQSTFEQFQKEKLNWVNLSNKVTDLLYQCKDCKQYQKGLAIIDMFSKQLAKQP